MTHYCSNNLEINGKKQELDELETLLATGERAFDFDVISQCLNGEGWLEWRLLNWGTKYPTHDPILTRESDTTIKVQFDTAQDPPIPLIADLARRFPSLCILLKYLDYGCELNGSVAFENGIMTSAETDQLVGLDQVCTDGRGFKYAILKSTDFISGESTYQITKRI